MNELEKEIHSKFVNEENDLLYLIKEDSESGDSEYGAEICD